MKFEKPEVTVVSFDAADVVCTSGASPSPLGFSTKWSFEVKSSADNVFSVDASEFN